MPDLWSKPTTLESVWWWNPPLSVSLSLSRSQVHHHPSCLTFVSPLLLPLKATNKPHCILLPDFFALLLQSPSIQQGRSPPSHHTFHYCRASIFSAGRMLCVCRRSKDMRRIEVGVSISCWTCQTLQRSVQSAGTGGDLVCGRRCGETVGCWSRRAAQRQGKEERRRQQQEEEAEEEEEDSPMTPRGRGGIVLEDGQLPPTEPRLMRCRAVRRDWNLHELCKEVGVA